MNIDCTLSKLVIPGFPEMNLEFGTKKADNASGSAREAAQNAMLPFERHRPIPVIENSDTTEIQDHVSFIMQNSGVILTLGNAAFYGCRVNVFNSSDGEVHVIYTPQKTKTILSGGFAEFKNLPAGWFDVMEFDYPIGKLIRQYPGEKSPIDNGLPGNWEEWNQRISMLGLALTAPSSTFAEDFATHGVNIWNLNTDGSVATQGTKKYTKPDGYLCTERVKGGLALADDDWAIGHQIVGGQYDGYFVWEPLCLAGAFPSIDDGGTFRPPFEGGVHTDRSRKIVGKFTSGAASGTSGGSGVFFNADNGVYNGNGGAHQTSIIGLDSARVLVTGPQGSPVTFSANVWCRTF